MAAQGTPRKFSEKIAILQRKLNEEEDAFAAVMRDVRSITSTDGTTNVVSAEAVDPSQQLMPGQWNRPGGSLPNVHQIVQNEVPGQWGYWESPAAHQRGRSPGSSAHFHPYNKPRSQERVPPHHLQYTQFPPGAPQHLQPPEFSAGFYRARSDPTLHSAASHSHPALYGPSPYHPHMIPMMHPQMHPYPGPMQPPFVGPGPLGQPPPRMLPVAPPQQMNGHHAPNGPSVPPNSINMVVHQMQPGPSMNSPTGPMVGSPMTTSSPGTSPPHHYGQPLSMGSPAGSNLGSPMQTSMASGPVSPSEEYRLGDLCQTFDNDPMLGTSMANGGYGQQTQQQQQQQQQQLNFCGHQPIGQRHSTGCVNKLATPFEGSQSAPTSPQQFSDVQPPPSWPQMRTFSNSPEIIDIPNIVLTGADGDGGELDCFQMGSSSREHRDLADLRLDAAEMQILCSGAPPDPLSETQLLEH